MQCERAVWARCVAMWALWGGLGCGVGCVLKAAVVVVEGGGRGKGGGEGEHRPSALNVAEYE